MNLCTLATEDCFNDFKVYLFSLGLYNKDVKIYVMCDKFIETKINEHQNPNIIAIPELDKYGKISRKVLERRPGLNYKTSWEDFMMEKTRIMDIAFNSGAPSVFFTDCDICFMGPLPEIPDGSTLGLSPHFINENDERKFGKYNAGFLWTNSKEMPEIETESDKLLLEIMKR